jgi:CubicO group peptidase (beta-lactamase class C family)
MVVRGGRHVADWGNQSAVHLLYSGSKLFGSIVTGVAIKDGMTTLDTFVQPALPEITVPNPDAQSAAWLPLVTVERLLTHTAGFGKQGTIQPLLFQPGTAWSYSDAGANWLAGDLTGRYSRDLDTVPRPRVLEPLGIPVTDLP